MLEEGEESALHAAHVLLSERHLLSAQRYDNCRGELLWRLVLPGRL